MIGEIVIAFRCRPSKRGEVGTRSSQTRRGVSTRRDGLPRQFRRVGERKNHAKRPGVENAFGRPEFVHGRADEGDRRQAARGENNVAQHFQADGRMFHLDPKKIETKCGGLCGDFNVVDVDRDADDGLAALQF